LTMGVPHGCCFGMLGPNGAGKTTTINMLGLMIVLSPIFATSTCTKFN
jgi:ABC-type multidrug transport system ATPase subunit